MSSHARNLYAAAEYLGSVEKELEQVKATLTKVTNQKENLERRVTNMTEEINSLKVRCINLERFGDR